MDRARPFPDAARSIVTLSNPQTPFAESATHRRKALRKALFRLVRGCYSPRRRRKRTVAHADKPTGATHHPLAGSAAQGPSRRASDQAPGHLSWSSRSVNHAAIQARSANAGSSPATHFAIGWGCNCSRRCFRSRHHSSCLDHSVVDPARLQRRVDRDFRHVADVLRSRHARRPDRSAGLERSHLSLLVSVLFRASTILA
jgi:hypothetical protein